MDFAFLTPQKYPSTLLTHPFKHLEWHKEKKTRHLHPLSLLRQGHADPQRVAIFGIVPRTPPKNGGQWFVAHSCRAKALGK